MNNFILSATLELKDKMTAGLKKTQYALSGIAGESLKVTKSTEKLKESLNKIKGDYSATVSLKDKASQTSKNLKSTLEQFKNKDYSAIVSLKNKASSQANKIKNELTSLSNKAFTAYVNIKTNMPNSGFNFNNKMNNFADGMLMGTSLQMAGMAGIGYTVYDTIKTPMDFDTQLSAIKALIPKDGVDGQTRDEIMSQVRARAMQLGQDTVFGNTEVAKGMTELIKAGVQLKDVLGEASEAALNLATAGGLDLAESAETMSTAMNAFKVNDATHAANILAGAANASATDVHELGYALSMCSAVASGAGVSFEDTNTTLAVFAQNGLKGSDAGTSLKTMLSNLIPKTKTQIEAFSKLNLLTEKGTSAFFDQQGKVKTLAEIAGLLQDRLKGMTKEEQLATLYDMFGSDAIRSGMILMREGAEGVTKMFNEMNKVTAKDVAITMLDNLKGDIEELSGAWENFQITLMSGSANSGLRGLVQELTDIVKVATAGLKDGFGLDDVFTLTKKGIVDLTNKFIAFDGIGSVLAGGALFWGLKKIYGITVGTITKIKDIVNMSKGLSDKLPTGTDKIASAKDLVINAQNVYVNGKTTSASKPNNNSSTILGPNGKPLPSSRPQPPISKPPAPLSWRERLKGIFSKGLESSKKYSAKLGKLGLGIGIPLGAYSIYNAKEGERGLETARVASSLAGGYVGAKAGSIAGGTVGSIIPGIGTGAGAIIGGVLGGISGSIIGEKLINDIRDSIINGLDEVTTSITEVGNTLYNNLLAPIGNFGIDCINFIVGSVSMMGDIISPYVSALGNGIKDMLIVPVVSGVYWLGEQIAVKFGEASNSIQEIFSGIGDWFSQNVFEPISSKAYSVCEAISEAFNSASNRIKSVFSGVSSWLDANVWSPISSKARGVMDKISEIREKGANITGLESNLGHNATGTMFWSGGLTEINERGGEIVDLPTGSRIYPAQTSERLIRKELSNNTNSLPNITISGNNFIIREEADIEKIADELTKKFMQASSGYGGIC